MKKRKSEKLPCRPRISRAENDLLFVTKNCNYGKYPKNHGAYLVCSVHRTSIKSVNIFHILLFRSAKMIMQFVWETAIAWQKCLFQNKNKNIKKQIGYMLFSIHIWRRIYRTVFIGPDEDKATFVLFEKSTNIFNYLVQITVQMEPSGVVCRVRLLCVGDI